jgi:hypothetical protein
MLLEKFGDCTLPSEQEGARVFLLLYLVLRFDWTNRSEQDYKQWLRFLLLDGTNLALWKEPRLGRNLLYYFLVNSPEGCDENRFQGALAAIIQCGADCYSKDEHGYTLTYHAAVGGKLGVWHGALSECRLDVQAIFLQDLNDRSIIDYHKRHPSTAFEPRELSA